MPATFTSRKEQILHVAAMLFSKKGYVGTSMRDIAEHMEIEAASLYNHISGKEELLHSICFSMADFFIQNIEEVNDIYFNGEEKLRMTVKGHVSILADNLPEAHVFLKEWKHLSEDNLTAFIKLRDIYENGIQEMLQTGIQENVFQEVDKRFATYTILASVNAIVDWYKPEGGMKPGEIADKLCDFILTGLKKEKPY